MKQLITTIILLFILVTTAAAGQGTIRLLKNSQIGNSYNSYIIETKQGYIAIDTPLAGAAVINLKQDYSMLDKLLMGVIITSADYATGLSHLLDGFKNVTILTPPAAAISEHLPPAATNNLPPTAKSKIASSGDIIMYDGIELRLEVLYLGGCNRLLIHFPAASALFVGELIASNTHPLLNSANSSLWLEQLGHILSRYPDVTTIYPSYGEPGELLLVNQQIEYLNTLQNLIRREMAGNSNLPPAGRTNVIKEILRRYPTYALAGRLEEAVDVVSKELQEKKVIVKPLPKKQEAPPTGLRRGNKSNRKN